MSKWLAGKASGILAERTSRRGFLARTALTGTALSVGPLDLLLTPKTAWAVTCSNCAGGSACCDGYTEFCCTITGGNTCPGGTVPGGWWKADGSGFCGGAPRYYIDCNVAPGQNPCSCGCANGNCGLRHACCTQFRYGQCHQEIPNVGRIMCRVVTCTPPWVFDATCTTTVATDNNTRFHDAPCLHVADNPFGNGPAAKFALVDGGWFLRNSNTSGSADTSFLYGTNGDKPVVGDWNGDGADSIGIFRNGFWYLRNSNSSGSADVSFGFGLGSDIPVVGDWNGDGRDGVGVFRNGRWFLRNSLSTGEAEQVVDFGLTGDFPIVGRWVNGVGHDCIGVVRKDKVYLRNSLTSGVADISFQYGAEFDRFIVGDWDNDGVDTPGVFRAGQWYLRNSNSSGSGDVQLQYGAHPDFPLVGRWHAGAPHTVGVAR